MKKSAAKGATLIEVLAVGAIFSALMAAILLIYTTAVRAGKMIELRSDVDRIVMIAVRNVDATLRSSRLVQPDDWLDPKYVSEIELTPFKTDENEQPSVTEAGFPEWGDPVTLTFDMGELARVDSRGRKVVATVGEQGFVRFIRPERRLLQMQIRVEKKGHQEREKSRETSFQFLLFNQ